jgi:hypothetical protein
MDASGVETVDEQTMLTENGEVLVWRVQQFVDLGFAAGDAWKLAESSADLGQARLLAQGCCPLDVALRILL